MSTLSTHILDIARGCPAADLTVILYQDDHELARGRTNPDGRITDWFAAPTLAPGYYTLRFETKPYFDDQALTTLYPFIDIHFELGADAHYHIPLLLSPWGYSTYRGS